MRIAHALSLSLTLALCGTGFWPASAADPTPEALEFFEREIRPLLVAHCHECHSDAAKLKGGLSLASRAAVLTGGESGPAGVPGKPAESLLVEAIRYQGLKMPPKAKLPEAEISKLVRWVEMGLPWTPGDTQPAPVASEAVFTISDAQRAFWSFQPVKAPAPPAVVDAAWTLTPIDRFILAPLEARGLRPNPPADKRTLLRRVTFDLTGLPPTPDEVAAFVADDAPEAFARVIDRLLASEHYGQRWGRHWLDVVRYADTAGETADYPVPQAYKYRNYVIEAFNGDKPYDEFIREQIAGDILAKRGPPEAFAERITATGYLAISRRFGFDSENYHHLTIADTLDTLGRSVLGLSIGCARCHDHKYDPISTADYYALYGIFASSRYAFPGSEEKRQPRDFVPLVSEPAATKRIAEHEQKLAELNAAVKRLEGQVAELDKGIKTAAEQAAAGGTPTSGQPGVPLADQRQVATATLNDARAKRDALIVEGPCEMAYGIVEGTAGNTKIQKRGEPTKPGAEVPRRFLEILGGDTLPAGTTGSGRLELAGWLTRRSNPLTARVIVNRVWQQHFGRGLVQGGSDFGLRGRAPSHPELLDYLASGLMNDGWSLKRLHRQILLSRVYQQSSDARLANEQANPAAEADPDNTLWWRFERRRLDAEAIRDAMLAVSGQLDRSPGGPHPFPPRTTWGFTQHAPFKAVYETNRRSVYLMTQRISRHPFLAIFDGADPNASTAERTLTTTPSQALFLMNDPFVHSQGEALARRLLAEEGIDAQRVARAVALVLGLEVTAPQLAAAGEFLERYRRQAAAGGATSEAANLAAWSAYARVLLTSNEFLYID